MSIWPIHLKIQEDESIASWIARSAAAFGFAPHELIGIALSRRTESSLDYDVKINKEDIAKLSTLSGNSTETLQNAMISTHTCSPSKECPPRNWLNNAFCPRTQKRITSLCPICMETDSKPYFRKEWRYAYNTVCKNHSICLIDRCPNCETPFSTDNTLSLDGLTQGCTTCGHHYSQMATQCRDKVILSNQFLAEVNNETLKIRVEAYSSLKYILDNMFGKLSYQIHYADVRAFLSEIDSTQSQKRLEALYCGTNWTTPFRKQPIRFRHEALRLAFLLYTSPTQLRSLQGLQGSLS